MKKTKNNTVRSVALDILLKVEQGSGYSHLLIDQQMKQKTLSHKDEGLLTEIVYGTIQRQMTIDYYLEPFIQTKKSLQPWVTVLLRMSYYQMFFLDRIPDHAIIHEAVEIAKQRGHQGIGSFVNGVLRNVRRKKQRDIADIVNKETRLAIETSHPEWLINRWIDAYGYDTVKAMAEANLMKKPVSVRVQPLKMTRHEAMTVLEKEGYAVEPSKISPQGIVIKEGNILHASLFKKGMLTIQDQSSMLVTEILNPKEHSFVLDTCSAPGGKTTHIAEKMQNKGNIHAYDIHKKKAQKVQDSAKHLGIDIVVANGHDARKLDDYYDAETFDYILVDAPCSGLGVIRSKPEIKYHKTAEDIENLASIQLDILKHVAPMLKKSGTLVYSTCTVDKAENEAVIQQFLTTHDEFTVDESFIQELPVPLQQSNGITKYGLQIFPQTMNTDGFFITRLVRVDREIN